MGLYELYDYYWNEMADHRVKGWFFMDSIFSVPLILLCYLYVVLQFGPRYMKNRTPYTLKNYTRFYNVFQVIANYWMVKSLIDAGWFTKIPLICTLYVPNEDTGTKILNLMWWNLLIKLADLSETVVFVLRKKERQISVLHLYHHITTVMFQWVGMRYLGDGMATFLAVVNSAVHVIMYAYYFLSTFPEIQKSVARLKPFITIIQMTQFCVLILFMSQALLLPCDVSWILVAIGAGNIVINFVLFYDFYQKSYVKSQKRRN